jgi:Ran GTPase-activating protein (RanGAP) involved in mRNA processing and transport
MGPSSVTARLRAAYLAECASLGCPPIAPFVEALDAHVTALAETGSSADELRRVELNGNSARLFEDRVMDDQAVALANALRIESDVLVRDLDLSYNRIGDAGAAALAEMCEVNRNVQTLNLRGNEIGPAGCARIAKALACFEAENNTGGGTESTLDVDARGNENLDASASGARRGKTNLRYLDLAWNPLGDDGGCAVALALQTNATLEHLDLEACDLGLKALVALCGAVREGNETLRFLSLESPREFSAADEHAWPAARALGANASLRTFKCGKWGLKYEGFEILVRYGLRDNRSLLELDVRCNRVDETGGVFVARALCDARALQKLNLEGNNLGDVGAAAIAEALPFARSLRELDVRGNGIGERGLVALAAGFARAVDDEACAVLRVVRLWGNDFGKPGSDACGAWEAAVARANARGFALDADIEFSVVDGLVHVARATKTKTEGSRNGV